MLRYQWKQIREMVERCYIPPSVIFFSMKEEAQAESKLRKGSVRDFRKEKIRNNHLGEGESEFILKKCAKIDWKGQEVNSDM